MIVDKLLRQCMVGGGATDTLKRVPTTLDGPLKRAQDAIAVLLTRCRMNELTSSSGLARATLEEG
jgi:hypothetical protein